MLLIHVFGFATTKLAQREKSLIRFIGLNPEMKSVILIIVSNVVVLLYESQETKDPFIYLAAMFTFKNSIRSNGFSLIASDQVVCYS